jgi:hypothetical protein
MKRTQIYIDEKTFSILKNESKMRKISVSEIIRESLEKRNIQNVESIIKNLENIFGIWKNKKMNINSYLRKTRRDRKI